VQQALRTAEFCESWLLLQPAFHRGGWRDILVIPADPSGWSAVERRPATGCPTRAFDGKVESVMGDSHEGANQIQDLHWNKGASHEWESLIRTTCANGWLRQSKPVILAVKVAELYNMALSLAAHRKQQPTPVRAPLQKDDRAVETVTQRPILTDLRLSRRHRLSQCHITRIASQ
jgi:hypothetical protein